MTEPITTLPEPPLFRHEDRLPATTPLTLLASAVDRGLDADQLDKLLTLQERWERNQAERAFNEAMHACQEEMPRIIRDSKNIQTGSMYASLETVQDAARPIYARHGFSLSYGEADCPTAGYKRTVCDVRHIGGHCVRYHLDLPVDGIGPKGNPIGGMNAVQGCISTTSYGQRRLLCMIFNITIAFEDNDAQHTATVTEEQIAQLKEWFTSSGEGEGPTLRFCKVKSVVDIPAATFAVIVERFRRKYANN